MAGVVGAVVLPVVGIGVGVSQTIRGGWNTPLAIMEASKGKYWDKVGVPHPPAAQFALPSVPVARLVARPLPARPPLVLAFELELYQLYVHRDDRARRVSTARALITYPLE